MNLSAAGRAKSADIPKYRDDEYFQRSITLKEKV
jgi:hypothetical protein